MLDAGETLVLLAALVALPDLRRLPYQDIGLALPELEELVPEPAPARSWLEALNVLACGFWLPIAASAAAMRSCNIFAPSPTPSVATAAAGLPLSRPARLMPVIPAANNVIIPTPPIAPL
jgi:hypothetical protein